MHPRSGNALCIAPPLSQDIKSSHRSLFFQLPSSFFHISSHPFTPFTAPFSADHHQSPRHHCACDVFVSIADSKPSTVALPFRLVWSIAGAGDWAELFLLVIFYLHAPTGVQLNWSQPLDRESVGLASIDRAPLRVCLTAPTTASRRSSLWPCIVQLQYHWFVGRLQFRRSVIDETWWIYISRATASIWPLWDGDRFWGSSGPELHSIYYKI